MTAPVLPVAAMVGISGYVAAYHLALHVRRRDLSRRDLYFSVSAALICAYDVFCIGLYQSTSVEEARPWQRLQMSSLALAATAFVYFVEAHAGLRAPRWMRRVSWTFPLLAVIALVERRGWLITDEDASRTVDVPLLGEVVYHEAAPGPLFYVIALIGPYLIAYLTLIVSRLDRSPDRRRAVPLAMGVGLFLIGVVNDTFVGAGLLASMYVLEYAWTGTIAVVGYSLSEDVVEAATTRQELAEARALRAHADRLELVGRLAGGVAHDLNNMLTPVLGYAELLRRRLPEGSPELGYVDHVVEGARRAAALTQRLLAFGRRQTLQVRAIDLGRSVRELEPLMRRLLPEAVTLTVEVDPHLPPVEADPTQLEQVWMNLVVNARDAMPDGGALTVRVRPADAEDGHLAVVVEVSDTGVGMDAATLERIFEPYFTTKGSAGGSGLGLSTVEGIVRQHEGRIAVESERGVGSTFRILLRATASAPETAGEHGPDAAIAGRGERVLVVDDDAVVLGLVADVLAGLGYVVRSAGSASEVEAAVASMERIDVVVTDVVLPDTDGARIREAVARAWPDAACVFMTGHAEEILAPRGLLRGDVTVLAKPFATADLARAVREALDRRAPRG